MAASCPWRCAGMLVGVLGLWLGCERVAWTGWDSLARTCREGRAWARMGGSNAWRGLREVWREPLRVPWRKGPWRGPCEGAAGQARACRWRAQGVGERERSRPQKVVGARPRPAWDLAPWRGAVPVLLLGCSSVHTFGMRYAIDVSMADEAGRVLASWRALPPGRVVWARGARHVLERPSSAGLWPGPGDQIVLRDVAASPDM